MSGLKSRTQHVCARPTLGPRFRGSWPLEGLVREEVRLGRRVEADDVVVDSLPCAPPNFNKKSEDAQNFDLVEQFCLFCDATSKNGAGDVAGLTRS